MDSLLTYTQSILTIAPVFIFLCLMDMMFTTDPHVENWKDWDNIIKNAVKGHGYCISYLVLVPTVLFSFLLNVFSRVLLQI